MEVKLGENGFIWKWGEIKSGLYKYVLNWIHICMKFYVNLY
jgi:hypothetical protein